jgi:hypothetical protein
MVCHSPSRCYQVVTCNLENSARRLKDSAWCVNKGDNLYDCYASVLPASELASELVTLMCKRESRWLSFKDRTALSIFSIASIYGTFAIPTRQNACIFTSNGYVSRMRLLYAAPSMTAGDLSQSKPPSGISDACALTMSLHATVLNLQSHLNVLEKSVASLRIEPGA